jgi:multidrug resistance efflux pump
LPWTPKPISQLERQIETLQIKLLRANSELRLKTVYAQRLEFLLQHRMATIDELVAKLDQARAQNKRLEAEADHLAALIAAPVPTAEITSSQSQASGAEISN